MKTHPRLLVTGHSGRRAFPDQVVVVGGDEVCWRGVVWAPPKKAFTFGRNRYHSMAPSMTKPNILATEPNARLAKLARTPMPDRMIASTLAQPLPVQRPQPTSNPRIPNTATIPPRATPIPAGRARPRAEKSDPLITATPTPRRSTIKPPRISKIARIAIPAGLGGFVKTPVLDIADT